MAEVTYKLTIFLRLTFDADKVPLGAALREELIKAANDWAVKECDIWKCLKHTTAVNVT